MKKTTAAISGFGLVLRSPQEMSDGAFSIACTIIVGILLIWIKGMHKAWKQLQLIWVG